jgi:hypothetical protein
MYVYHRLPAYARTRTDGYLQHPPGILPLYLYLLYLYLLYLYLLYLYLLFSIPPIRKSGTPGISGADA